MSPESQSLADCYKWRMECQEKSEKRHREVIEAIGELRDYVATERGKEAGAKAERDKATSSQKAIGGNGRKSWVGSLGVKILEWVVMTAIIGGLMYALKNNDKDLAGPSPAPVAKP